MGYDAIFIQKRNWPLSLKLRELPLKYSKRIVKRLAGRHIPILFEQKFNHDAPIVRQYVDTFIKNHINVKTVDDYSEIKEKDFDAIIVGSDQIWRPAYFKQIEKAFLNFAKNWNIKRIAYAASFGTDKWEYSKRQTIECGNLLKYFDAVSVRELSGIELCDEHFCIDAKLMLDPTMLLDANDYIKLLDKTNTQKSKGNLLVYLLDTNKEKLAITDKIAKSKQLTPFIVNSEAENMAIPADKRIQPPVEQWLRGFYDAEFVITDSFHGCVFSILFQKPFVVIGNINRGMSRFNSLLKIFGLEDRMISPTQIDKIKCKDNMNWNKIYSILQEYRNKAQHFLETALN